MYRERGIIRRILYTIEIVKNVYLIKFTGEHREFDASVQAGWGFTVLYLRAITLLLPHIR